MQINAIRFRGPSEANWQAFKMPQGAGRLRAFVCLAADPSTLEQAAAAIQFVLTGRLSSLVSEAQLQLSDDAGDTWIVARKPGHTRILKNGVNVEGDAEASLVAALLDLDFAAALPPGQQLAVPCFGIGVDGETLTLKPFGTTTPAAADLQGIAARQMTTIAADAARVTGIAAFSDPLLLTKAARRLEPIWTAYKELARQFRDVAPGNETVTDEQLAGLGNLAKEVALIRDIAEAAQPLLAPGFSLKALREEEQKHDEAISKLCLALGVDSPDAALNAPDYRKAIEALCRLEAYAKLIRASQGSRKYCEQNVEPLYERYLDITEKNLAGDRQIASELESCIATLNLKMRSPQLRGPGEDKDEQTQRKNWFERFKSRQEDDVKVQDDGVSDLETARMAIEYALGRLTELQAGLSTARARRDSTLTTIDSAHEELIKAHGRLRDHWLTIARDQRLPEDATLAQLVRLITGQGQLAALVEQRRALSQRIQRANNELTRLERQVGEWRKLTGSQKHSDLTNPSILLTEARDVLRYHDAKTKKLAQMGDAGVEAKVQSVLRRTFKTRRDELTEAWRVAFQELGVTPLALTDQHIGEMLKRGQIVQALALVHGSGRPQTGAVKLFDDGSEHPLSVYVWSDQQTNNRCRLAFMEQLQSATGEGMRIVLVADQAVAQMAAPLGMGIATRINQPLPEATKALARPGSPVVKKTIAAGTQPKPAQPNLVNEQAKRAFDILTSKRL